MAQFLILAIIILYALWAVSFLLIWINQIRIARMIDILERAVDYALLKSDLYAVAATEGWDKISEREKDIRENLETIKQRIRKDFDVE